MARIKKSEVMSAVSKFQNPIFDYLCDWLGISGVNLPIIFVDGSTDSNTLFGSIGKSTYDYEEKVINITSLSVAEQVKIRKRYSLFFLAKSAVKELLAEELTHFLHFQLAPCNINVDLVSRSKRDAIAFLFNMAVVEAIAYYGVLQVISQFKIEDQYFKNISLRVKHCEGVVNSYIVPLSQLKNAGMFSVDDSNYHRYIQAVVKYVSCKIVQINHFPAIKYTSEFIRNWDIRSSPSEQERSLFKSWLS